MELNLRNSSLYCSVLVTVLLLVLSPSKVAGDFLTDEQIAAIEEIITTKFLGEQQVPGMGISIIQGDNFEKIWARGYGFENIEENIPAKNETLFGIGSLSKMISSLYIVKLISDKFPDLGEGVLDTPIRTLAPDYNLKFIDRYRSEQVTFRDILSHKVCIATSTDIMAVGGAFEDKYDVVHRQRYCASTCGFRSTNWAYNNALVHTAAEVAAHIHGTGEAFEDLLVQFLRDEVGMKDTRTVRENDNIEDIPNMSSPYYRRAGELHPFNFTLMRRAAKIPAAGAILVTATDMAHFMAVVGNFGVRMDGRRVVQEHVMQWLTRNSNPYRSPPYKSKESDRPKGDAGYGIGVQIGSSNGWQRLRHVGYVAPYSGTLNVFPKRKLAIFTAASGPGNSPNHDMIHDRVWDVIHGYVKFDEEKEARTNERSEFDDFGIPSMTQAAMELAAQHGRPATAIVPNAKNTIPIPHSLLAGTYGLGVSGHFRIDDVNATTLYLTFGTFASAFLHQRAETPAVYDGELDSDIDHQWYSENYHSGNEFPEFIVDFSIPLIASISAAGTTLPFVRGFTADTLPEQPYADDSC